MKISGTGPIRSSATRAGKAARATASSAFSSNLVSDVAPANAVAPATSINPVDGILAIQEVSDTTDGRSRGIKHGHNLLDRLDELRHDLLTGMFHHDRLLALRREIKDERVAVEDPRLMAILDDIDLRASVELAKLGIT